MILDTTNGHNSEVVKDFNNIANKFETSELLEIILKNWCDDEDLKDITELLKDRYITSTII